MATFLKKQTLEQKEIEIIHNIISIHEKLPSNNIINNRMLIDDRLYLVFCEIKYNRQAQIDLSDHDQFTKDMDPDQTRFNYVNPALDGKVFMKYSIAVFFHKSKSSVKNESDIVSQFI